MTDTVVKAVNDTLKGLTGIIGIEATEAVHKVTTDEIGILVAHVLQGVIALLTIVSLIKSIFSNPKK